MRMKVSTRMIPPQMQTFLNYPSSPHASPTNDTSPSSHHIKYQYGGSSSSCVFKESSGDQRMAEKTRTISQPKRHQDSSTFLELQGHQTSTRQATLSARTRRASTSFFVYADSAQCNFCCRPTLYSCRRKFHKRFKDSSPCADVSCKDPKYGCGWVPDLQNVSPIQEDSIENNDRLLGPDPNMRPGDPGPNEKAKCYSCADLTKLHPADRLVGCVPYANEEEHFQILRSDGLSRHPLRKHRPRNKEMRWKYPMGYPSQLAAAISPVHALVERLS
ncbi:unnamed protein product [Amoebophrya sp. A25]|nr:unnamed protein product [Amoebophrya sp. A25]|eukprot:GSA25T00016340001.1